MDSLLVRILVTASLCLISGDVLADEPRIDPPSTVTTWGKIVPRQMALELRVLAIPDDRVIDFPRLNNRMKTLYVEGMTPEQSGLQFRPQIETWEVILPESQRPGDATVIVFETLEPIQFAKEPHIVQQAQDGSITLPAHHAVTHGKLLRFEPQPHKNTVGYWADANDWVEWRIHVQRPATFEIEVLQGCGKGQGGSIARIDVAGKQVEFVVEDTGHFQNFKPRRIGAVTVSNAGEYALEIRAIEKAKAAVCDIRQVRLVPAGQ